jgi:tripartite-type tricarboxylate transporter receptor subunit TctC
MRSLFRILLSSIALSVPLAAWSQGFPSKPVRLIVLFPAGGPSDIVARLLGAKLGEVLGQNVIVDNRVGANGIIGTEHVAKSTPDGYTFMIASASSVAMNYAVVAKLPYDTVRDLTCVSLVSTTPELLAVHPSIPAQSVKELVSLAKARPGQINMASTSSGGMPHLALELFKSAAHIDLLHVPYNGAAPAVTAVLGGQVHGLFADLPVLQAHIASGKLRPLAIASPKRSPLMPNVLTMVEQGLPTVEAVNWSAIFVPSKTPPELILKLHDALGSALNDGALREKLMSNGANPIPSTSEYCSTFIKGELTKWGRIAKEARVKME